jgi:hypothetical protein
VGGVQETNGAQAGKRNMKNLQNSGLTRGKPGRRTRKPLAGARRRRRLGNEAAQSPKIRERRRKSPQEIRLGSFPGEEPAEVDGRSGSGNEGCGREGEEKTCGLRPRREESRPRLPRVALVAADFQTNRWPRQSFSRALLAPPRFVAPCKIQPGPFFCLKHLLWLRLFF